MQEKREASPQDDAEVGAADGTLNRSWADLENALGRERGIGGRLRQAPLAVRAAFAGSVAVAMPILAALLMPREDLGTVPTRAWVLAMAAVIATAGFAAVLAAWPVHVRAVRHVAVIGLGIATGAIALLSALTMCRGPLGTESLASVCVDAVRCGGAGLIAAIPAGLAAHAVRRDAVGASVGVASLAALSGFVAVSLTCAIGTIEHVVVAHALPSAALIAAVTLLFVWPRRARAVGNGA